jgi:hypothetical protein
MRYPISAAVVCAAVLGAAAVFAFARPEYHAGGHGRTISFAKYPAPTAGWTWSSGEPGFRFDDADANWREISGVGPADLASARRAAPRFGVGPATVRPLHSMRLSSRDLFLLVAGTDSHSQTCLGAVLPRTPVTFYCPTAAAPRRLHSQVAFLMVAGRPRVESKTGNGHGFTHYTVFPLFLMGAVRADVTKVVVSVPGLAPATFYEPSYGWWGTFDGTPGDAYVRGQAPNHPWEATVWFFGSRGLLATSRIRFDRPTSELLAVRKP